MVSIAKYLKVKADEAEVLRAEMEQTKISRQSFGKNREDEDVRVKELVDDLHDKQTQAAEDVRNMRAEVNRLKEELSRRPSEEEVERLKKELADRPMEEEVLRSFRSLDAYYAELNEKAAKKIYTTWTIASKYLYENPGGDFEGFIPVIIAEEERVLAET